MNAALASIVSALIFSFRSRLALQTEILALRHQINFLHRSTDARRKLHTSDRVLWVWLSRLWPAWRSALLIVKPETVIHWHRQGFRLYWRWKSRRLGRPDAGREIRELIRKMCLSNPTWGAPRVHGELLRLGLDVSQSTVSKYMVRPRKPPSQTWRTFLKNHVKQLVSVDFFVVHTIDFKLLFVFLVLAVLRQNPGRVDPVDFLCLGTRHFPGMILMILRLLSLIPTTLRLHSDLALENLALRQQLAVLNRRRRRPKLRKLDRFFWVLLSRSWEHWKETLVIVRPETVLRWHRRLFTSYWTRLSGHNGPGRPGKDREIRELIRKMAKSNPLWGAPRVHRELLKLGIDISERTVSRWMPRRTKPASRNWRAFLDNHIEQLVSIDFFTVPTATFRVLFVLIVLAHDRRRIVHFNVTEHPTAEWMAQQMVEAVGDGKSPRYLIRDRDGVSGLAFRDRVKALDIEEVVIAPHSLWQDPHAERVIGTLRRECFDHVVILGETHLRRIVRRYVKYYHGARTHLALDKDAPEHRSVQPPERGTVVEIPEGGGLHHHYERRAA